MKKRPIQRSESHEENDDIESVESYQSSSMYSQASDNFAKKRNSKKPAKAKTGKKLAVPVKN